MVLVERPTPTVPQDAGLLRVYAWWTLPWPVVTVLLVGVVLSVVATSGTVGLDLAMYGQPKDTGWWWFTVPLAIGALLSACLFVHRRVVVSVTPHHVEIDGERIAWEDVRLAEWGPSSQGIRLRDGGRRAWRLWLSDADAAALELATAAALVARKPRSLEAERDLRTLTAQPRR